MNPKRLLPAALLASVLLSGCVTTQTANGGRETSLLGGAMTVGSDPYPATGPAPTTTSSTTNEAEAPTTESGSTKKTSLLWGLIKL